MVGATAHAYYKYMISGDVIVREEEPVQEPVQEPVHEPEPVQEPELEDPDSPHIYMRKIRSCEKFDEGITPPKQE